MSAHPDLIHELFPPDLCIRINHAVVEHPDLGILIQDIARHVKASASISGPANSKKRKLEDGPTTASLDDANGTNGVNNQALGSARISNPTTAYECRDVSFQVPARKKMRLQLVSDTRDNQNSKRQEVRLLNNLTTEVDYAVPADQIEQVFCLPVPEKAKRQWNFVLFPKPGSTTVDGTPCEQAVFMMDEVAPAAGIIARQPVQEQDTFVTVTERALNALLQRQGKHIEMPNAAEFASSIPQPHRKAEKAYHVKAHRGSKDGYLFFLPSGIVFGFKKPLAFFPFARIEAISYTSVLQRTFNLVVTSRADNAEETQDVEFSMIDQADFAGIDEYIKRHELNDASMAAARRAKVHNVNKTKKEGEGAANGNGDVGGGAEGEDGLTELRRAEQELQDQEDEEEEDYVESGGESGSEGDYSEDEEGEEYGDDPDEVGAEEVEHDEDVQDE